MPLPRLMSGQQAKNLAGGCAILVGWAWTCASSGQWTPTADSGAALAVVLWVVFDVFLAGGAPEDAPVVTPVASVPKQDYVAAPAGLSSRPGERP